MDFSKAIRRLMVEKDIRTQREFAERSGLHENTVSCMVRGDIGWVSTLLQVASGLGVKPSELCALAEEYGEESEP